MDSSWFVSRSGVCADATPVVSVEKTNAAANSPIIRLPIESLVVISVFSRSQIKLIANISVSIEYNTPLSYIASELFLFINKLSLLSEHPICLSEQI